MKKRTVAVSSALDLARLKNEGFFDRTGRYWIRSWDRPGESVLKVGYRLDGPGVRLSYCLPDPVEKVLFLSPI